MNQNFAYYAELGRQLLAKNRTPCAACGDASEREFSIHRDGFCDGPEVWLCNGCVEDDGLRLPILWEMIAERREAGESMVENA